MEYIKKKWGRKGLEAVDARPEDYPMEKWYPFEDYCDLLGRIGRELGQDNGKLVAHMGEEMMSHDVRWRTIFKGKKPEDIFTSTKRQDAQYAVGHMNVVDTENHNVILKEKLWEPSCKYSELWNNFYQGRLQGVLNLTGRKGNVQVSREKELIKYHIKWS